MSTYKKGVPADVIRRCKKLVDEMEYRTDKEYPSEWDMGKAAIAAVINRDTWQLEFLPAIIHKDRKTNGPWVRINFGEKRYSDYLYLGWDTTERIGMRERKRKKENEAEDKQSPIH